MVVYFRGIFTVFQGSKLGFGTETMCGGFLINYLIKELVGVEEFKRTLFSMPFVHYIIVSFIKSSDLWNNRISKDIQPS